MRRSLFIIIFYSLLGITLSAQTRNVLSIPDYTIANSSQVVLPVDLENTSDVVAVQFTLQLPSGLNLDATKAALNAQRKDGHSMTFRSIGSGKYMCMINSVRNNKLKGNDGCLVSIPVSRTSSTSSEFTVSLTDVVIAASNGTDLTSDVHSGHITFSSLSNQVVCSGGETATEDFNMLSPLFDYSWKVKNEPTAIEGYLETGKNALPPMTLSNEGVGTESITYTVDAYYCGISMYTFEYSITVMPSLLGNFFNFTPRDKSNVSSNSIVLSWNNIINAVYDVYIWKHGEQRPENPVARNLTATQYVANNKCDLGETYNWCVVAHNECQEISSETHSFTVKDLPDLHVTRVDCSKPVAGKKMTIEWTVKNDGLSSTEDAEWNDYIWLIPDMKLGTSTVGSKLLKTVSNVKALAPGESYINTYEVTLDERIYGNYNILVTSDMYNVTEIDWTTEQPSYPYNPSVSGYLTAKTSSSYTKLSELTQDGKKDNFFYTKIDIAIPPLADLQIPKVEVLSDGVPVTEIFAGSTVEVKAFIQNKGDAAVVNKNVANILFRSTAEYHEDAALVNVASSYKTLNLAPDESCDETFIVNIPARYYGDLYFHVNTDKNDVVYELANTENNWGASAKISVVAIPGADLQPIKVTANSTSVSDNQSVNVSYTVENFGAGKPDVNAWTDKIYLCQNPNGLTAPYTLLSSVPVKYTGDKYTKDVNVNVGSHTGTYYICVVTDADDAVFEFEGEDNNVLRCESQVEFVKPDLTVELNKIYCDTIQSNDEVSFEWKIKNIGTGDLVNKRVTDSFYASTSENGANARYLGSVKSDLWIPAGGEKVLRGTITIPYGSVVDALQYIFVKTDTDNAANEESESNNTSNAVTRWCKFGTKPVAPSTSKYVDLVVTNVVSPNSAMTSSYLTLNWTCTNSGNVDAGEFCAAVYVSDDDKWSSDDIMLSSQRISSLAVGGIVDVQSSMYLKDDYSSKKYLIFVVDNGKRVTETDESNNYVAKPITLIANPETVKLPDLSVSFANAPVNVRTSEYFSVNWTVSNIGSSDVGAFTNGVYLSDDDVWSEDDVLIATQRTAALKQGNSADYTTHLCLADKYVGKKYLIFRTDINDNIDEETKANNIKTIATEITVGTKPEPPTPDYSVDLSISRVSIQSTNVVSSSDVTVNWTYINSGTYDALPSSVGLYLSNDEILDASDMMLATQFVALLKKGTSIDYQSSICIPEEMSGSKYIIVCADMYNMISESDETNNTKALAISVGKRPVTPAADLVATALSVPSSVNATEYMTTEWKVSNAGGVDAGMFMSALYLSNDASWSADDEMLASEFTDKLLAGQSVDYLFNVAIPQSSTGRKYLILRTDVYNTVSENDKRNNDVVVSLAVGSTPTEKKYADLLMESVNVPDAISTSEDFSVTMDIANNGSTDASAFVNAIYLSDDASYNKNDVLLVSERVSSLKMGEKVSRKVSLNIADKYNGNKYLIFKVNAYNSVAEKETSNNVIAVPVTIHCAPLADLRVKGFLCPKELVQGQEFDVNVTVVNNGEADTRQNRCVIEYYLSSASTFNKNSAAKIGSSTHSGILKAGEEYSDSVTLCLPQDINGNYMVYAFVDATNAIYESNENNNVSKGQMVQIYPVEERPVNLVINKLSAPLDVTAGENVTLTYKVSNTGEYSATGTLRDVIYLSKDDKWDRDDIQVGVVTGKVNIDAGQEIIREATGRVVNVPEGKYYFIVKTNSTRSIPELTDEDNVAAEYMASTVTFRSLQLGATENVNTCGYYKIDVNETSNAQTVAFNLTHPEETSAGLYVGYESVPSTAKHDYASFAMSMDKKTVILPVAKAGRYYILAQDNSSLVNNDGYAFSLDGASAWDGADMSLSAERVMFGASSLSMKEGGTDGWITTEIKGAMFDSIMDFRLAAEKRMIPAEHVVFRDQTSSSVTFNLRNAEVGTYDVISELPNGTRATLPDGFRVIPGVQCDLGIKIDAPRIVHSGSHSPVSIAFANGGTNDIQIKEILVRMRGAYLGKSVADFKSASSELHLVPEGYEADRFGYITIAPGTQKVINFFMEQHAATSYMTVYIVK